MKPGLLMVDDDEAIRTQMKWALSQDYDMCFAEDRRGALEAFEASAPAVTLLDLGLPPRPMLRCSCWERAALARKWQQRQFIVAACARTGRLSRSTATPFPKTFWRANFSGTKKAPLPVLMCSAKACWKQRVAAHCFWMRLASFHRRFR